jgi:1-acyl-sn-glycerol-3-phosphate acyltransferase
MKNMDKPDEPSSRRSLSPFWILFTLTGLNLFNYLDRYVLNAVRTPIATEFGLNYGQSGRMWTACMIGYFVTSPFFGYLGDRLPRKWLIASGIFVWSLATLLTGLASGFVMLLLFRVFVGLGEASYATISPSLISDAFGPAKRNNALTIFYVAIPVGSALGYILGGLISAHWGWRHAFIWAGVPGLILALVLLPFGEPRRGQAELASGQPVPKPSLRDYLQLLINPNYQLVVWGYVAYTFALGAFAFWGPTYLETIHHIPNERADGFFGGVLVVAGLLGTLIGGLAATAWHKRNPAGYAWLLCSSILLAVPTSFGAFLSSDKTAAMALLAVSMFLLFLSTGPVNTLIIETVPLNLRASAMALSIFMIHLFGDMWSPEIIGHLADGWNNDLRKAVMVLPLALLVGGAFWFALAIRTARRNGQDIPDAKPNPAANQTGPLTRLLVRFLLLGLTRTFYRVHAEGAKNLPAKGGALLVCNHLSLIDALLLASCTPRQIRFLMYKGFYEKWWIKPLVQAMGAIPISSELRPREMLQSLRTAGEALKNGELVCIFAEGQITRIGQMLPFRRGFEKIIKDVEVPIIPVALDGVWGSIFSFEKGRFIWKMPRRIPYRVAVNFGPPLPPSATPFEVRQAVQDLMVGAWEHRKTRMKPLHRAFLRSARLHPFRMSMADALSARVSFGSALTRTIFLARRLRKVWDGQHMVGLLLPPSVPGALVNFAALMMGKVPVNLNYTVSSDTLGSCIRQCGIKTVLTSKAFLEKLKLEVPAQTLLLEELAAKPSSGEKLFALFAAAFLPAPTLESALGRREAAHLDDVATVIFSSGSTGEPKGVMLSHYNIASNLEQMDQVFALNRHDGMLGILPLFHSFGFTGTLWLPAVLGLRVVFHPNPLDAKAIGQFVNDYSLTFLLATPTFLQLYMRGCSPEQFGSLRVVMTGAEKLPERLAAAFEEQFGIRPLEGFGCTECAPAVAVSTHDFRSAGFRQVGAKRGKIGHPVPGVSVRIVEPETFSPLPVGQPGLLLVRGPNIMQGYLGRPEKTAEAMREGWYVTGDIAAMDEDGFLQITDRLSRFSKIGGEMVPHIKVEEKLHELAGVSEQTFVVAGVPDYKKGERLIVLHKLTDQPLKTCLDKLAQSDLPNLWKPRADQFFRVESFPYLGTGKLDLRAVRQKALALSSPAEPVAATN